MYVFHISVLLKTSWHSEVNTGGQRLHTIHTIADREKVVLESCIIRKSLVCKSDNEVCVEMLYVKFFNLILFIVIIGFNMRT